MMANYLKRYFMFCVFVLNINLAQAQLGKEAWHWQFGERCALDFSTVNLTVGTDSIFTLEGSASISDSNTGQLLFYTDGTTVWDKNNHRMPNGYGMIAGKGTSTQAALIVPKPGSSNIYYLFSADEGGNCCGIAPVNQGIHYSIIDVNLNGGLGDVITKNILLTPPPTTEKLTAVKHCNGIDYWIITHPFNSNAFNVYLLTNAGISAIPVVSNTGTVQNHLSGLNYLIETVGYLKASPNGKKIACAVQYMQFLELFDFDNSTGIVSNPIKITDKLLSFYPYGIAFSPDNTKLFLSATDSLPNVSTSNLYEYDLSSGTSTGIMNSKIYISYHEFGAIPSGALQLAPNGKIYITTEDINLHVINNPNDTGSSCNYQFLGTPNFNGSTTFGLPNFIDANQNIPISSIMDKSLCSFSNYSLSVNGNKNHQWSTGDTTESLNINSFGNYWVSYLNTNGCKEIDTFHIKKVISPTINILHDTSICSNTSTTININATDTNAVTYLWSDGFMSPIHSIYTAGIYWVDYTLADFCVSRDSFSYTIPQFAHLFIHCRLVTMRFIYGIQELQHNK